MSGRLGILIAGGRGVRFGGPKALVIFRGRTLVELARESLAAVCDEVVVVAPNGLDLPVPESERVADRGEHEGPLSALVAGLEARSFTCALALAVDLPRLDRSHLARLLAAWSNDAALVPLFAGRLQPLAAVYSPASGAALRARVEAGERALVPAVTKLAPRTLDAEALRALGIPPEAFADADTPAELARLEAEGAGR